MGALENIPQSLEVEPSIRGSGTSKTEKREEPQRPTATTKAAKKASICCKPQCVSQKHSFEKYLGCKKKCCFF